MTSDLDLHADFPPSSPAEWRKAAEQGLKGASLDRLVTHTHDGVAVQPIYHRRDAADFAHSDSWPGFAPFARDNDAAGYQARCWDVCQNLPYSDPRIWNAAARYDLDRGQTALRLPLDAATRHGCDPDGITPDAIGHAGVSLATLADLATALDAIDLATVPLVIDAGPAALPALALLVAVAQQRGVAPAHLAAHIGADPLNTLVRDGTLPCSLAQLFDEMAEATRWAVAHAPNMQTIAIDTQPYHDGGGSATHELACALATGVAYLRELQQRGLDVEVIAPQICFTFAVGTDLFGEVAKLRAARVLWSQVVAAFGGSEAAQRMTLHIQSGSRERTSLDPYVNMLRATTEAIAGIVGGCDSLDIAPFDATLRPPDDFGRRVARNTQLVLTDEAHLAKVIDPAGGAWYLETLTDGLARNAWALFQQIEAAGGMVAALQSGFVQAQIAATAAERKQNSATRKDVAVGVNMYAHLDARLAPSQAPDDTAFVQRRAAQIAQYRAGERALGDELGHLSTASTAEWIALASAAASAGATTGEITAALRANAGPAPTIAAIPQQRSAAPFEALRAAANAFTERTGARPRVFLATMGPIAQHKARAEFATSFFAVGGFAAINGGGFAQPDHASQAALASGAPIVVICSTDATYPDIVPPLAKAIKAGRPDTVVVLAGDPKEHADAYRAAGVDECIHLRANAETILATIQQKIGVTA